ncbi:MAG: hypothetical protein OXN94_08145 [Chloroflexota bacterium]|nr:hypothetical protein [Chloroflexota bacterium]
MKLQFRFPAIIVNKLLTGIVLGLVLATALVAWQLPAPHLAFNYKETAIDVRADKAWALGPGDCLQITWQLAGSQSIHIEGLERRESGQASFCPAVFSPSPSVELTDHGNGFYRSYNLKTYYVPDLVANVLGLAALAFFPLLALYYLWTNRVAKPPALRTIFLAMLALCLCIAALRLAGLPLTIVGILAILRGIFTSTAWQYYGVVVTVVFFLFLLIDALRRGWKHRRIADFLVLGSFLLFIGLLYLPFGFDTIGQWEEWFGRGFYEGLYRRRLHTELSQRFLFLWPYAMGFLLSSESFTGYNLLHALFLWGKLVFFYGIMRCIGVRQLFAYLITMLFAVYPVDSGLMNLRSIALQFSALTLLAAIYLVLHYLRRPTRLRLAGVLLALVICVGLYEAQYALILVLSLLWWYRIRKPSWREVNLTAIWYLAPALKLTYLFLIALTGRSFYRSNYVYASSEIRADNLIPTTIDNLLAVYHRTFVVGWGDALTDLGRNGWLPLTLVIIALVGAVTWYLWRIDVDKQRVNEKRLIIGVLIGMLLIIPAVGVLIWFGYYSQDLWRLYLYVPGPAAIAVFCLIALIASRIPSERYRDGAIIIVCLLLTLPGASRLILQHEHFVVSANNKMRVLQQIVQIAPEMASETRVLVVSDMPADIRLSKHIEEMKSNMIGSALYVIYGGGSGLGFMCLSAEDCSPIKDWSDHLSNTLVFLLNDDLSLSLAEDPQTIFSEFRGLNYDATRLYNPDAPLPRRAYTMLGLTNP